MFTKLDNVTGSDRRGKSGSKRLKLTDFAVRAFFLATEIGIPFVIVLYWINLVRIVRKM